MVVVAMLVHMRSIQISHKRFCHEQPMLLEVRELRRHHPRMLQLLLCHMIQDDVHIAPAMAGDLPYLFYRTLIPISSLISQP